MSKEVPVIIDRLLGSMVIEAVDGTRRPATSGGKVKPGETIIPSKNSACVALGSGFTIAHILNTKGAGKTTVHVSHPLARHAKKPKERLKGTALRLGGKLVLQAQREGVQGVLTYSLIIKL
ncbi:MAG: hypothetical protein HZA92_10785 [Verrucomicrobia bacterium]|nr:hypothetical protein [Verrucomicrobiota bacterium]